MCTKKLKFRIKFLCVVDISNLCCKVTISHMQLILYNNLCRACLIETMQCISYSKIDFDRIIKAIQKKVNVHYKPKYHSACRSILAISIISWTKSVKYVHHIFMSLCWSVIEYPEKLSNKNCKTIFFKVQINIFVKSNFLFFCTVKRWRVGQVKLNKKNVYLRLFPTN